MTALRLSSAFRGLPALAAGLALWSFALLPAAPAAAIHLDLPSFTIEVGPAGSTTTVTGTMLESNSTSVVENADGSVSFLDGSMSTAMWMWSWDEITLKEDPVVSFAQAFTNLSGSAADFIFNTSLTTGPIGPTSLIGGSSSVSVADADDSGSATLASSTGQPGYAGLLDGSTELQLLDPFSLTAVFGGTNATSDSAGLSASGPTISAPAVASSIGITHAFNLTAHDTATFNSTFVVEPIPEPATVLLMGLGCAGLAVIARRVKR